MERNIRDVLEEEVKLYFIDCYISFNLDSPLSQQVVFAFRSHNIDVSFYLQY